MNTLENLMSTNGLTQRQFAETIGVTPGMVSQWITGRRPVSIEKALTIEEQFGLQAEILCPRLKPFLARRSLGQSLKN